MVFTKAGSGATRFEVHNVNVLGYDSRVSAEFEFQKVGRDFS